MISEIDRVRNALSFINTNNRDLWLKAAMAIKSEYGEGGFDLWDEWSQQGDTYNLQAAKSVWKSCKSGGVTLGTLIFEAKQNGYKDDATFQKTSIGFQNAKRRFHEERLSLKAGEVVLKQEQIAAQAAQDWAMCKPCHSHPYLTSKGISSHGVRHNSQGDLVIPMYDTSGILWSLQRITTEGRKLNTPNSKTAGCYFPLGKPNGVICICEGFSTGASIFEATGHAVAVAFGSGNLKSVAMALHTKFPQILIVVCGDDDATPEKLTKAHPNDIVNTGLIAAQEAAKAVDGVVAMPDFGSGRGATESDFNDLHQAMGLEWVARCIESVFDEVTL